MGCQPDIEKIYFYANNTPETKHQLLINKREVVKVGDLVYKTNKYIYNFQQYEKNKIFYKSDLCW